MYRQRQRRFQFRGPLLNRTTPEDRKRLFDRRLPWPLSRKPSGSHSRNIACPATVVSLVKISRRTNRIQYEAPVIRAVFVSAERAKSVVLRCGRYTPGRKGGLRCAG